MKIRCPGCGQIAVLEAVDEDQHANNNENMVSWPAPDGFRKVQLGWRVGSIYMYCVDCGIAAEQLKGDPAEK